MSFSFPEQRLADLGLDVAASRSVADFAEEVRPGETHTFAVSSSSLERGAIAPAAVPFEGGLVFRARDVRSGSTRPPAYLFDFTLEIDPETGETRVRSSDPALPYPFDVYAAGPAIDPVRGTIRIRQADLLISESWAQRLGAPALAGQWIGALDLELATSASAEALAPESDDRRVGSGGVLDVKLGELYNIKMMGHIGPNLAGTAGLSMTMTSCNNGTVDVPWQPTMDPDHPLIGMAMFREKDGVLEMIGRSWLKHAWGVLALDLCALGCQAAGATILGVGCSDTYSTGANALQYYLGPREEVNPFTAIWDPWGSYFDGIPVDGLRDYFGVEPNTVVHTLAVQDVDLDNLNSDGSNARYFYEGTYYVAEDDSMHNNVGWRECEMEWSEHWTWDFITYGAGNAPNPGPVVMTWGDEQDVANVGPGDGDVILSVDVTDLGGGQWHYEYALYNRHSDRGVRAFSVPVGDAVLSNVDFKDIDLDGGNDWSSSVSDGVLTWSTDDFATDPNANYLQYQAMYNFRFDADRAPMSSGAVAGIFKPGVGSTVIFDTQAPAPPVTAASGLASTFESFRVTNEPNPFSGNTTVRFSLAEERAVRLSVFDVAGRTVRTLVDGRARAGETAIRWDGRDANGAPVAAGIYFFRLESGDRIETAKGILIR